MVTLLQSLSLIRVSAIIRCWVQGSWRAFTSNPLIASRVEYKLLTCHEALDIIPPFPPPSSSHPGLYPVFRPHWLPAHSLDAQGPRSWTFPTPPCRSSFYSFQCLTPNQGICPVHGAPLASLSSLVSFLLMRHLCISCFSTPVRVSGQAGTHSSTLITNSGPEGRIDSQVSLLVACVGLRAGHLTPCDLPCQRRTMVTIISALWDHCWEQIRQLVSRVPNSAWCGRNTQKAAHVGLSPGSDTW